MSAGAIAHQLNAIVKLDPYPSLDFDGNRVFEALVAQLDYSKEHLIARYTLFTAPAVVAQSHNAAIFRIIRDDHRRGEKDHTKRVVYDDNTTPRDLFLKANALLSDTKDRGNQINHVYRVSNDVKHYTSLANLCMTPAFLAKLTDSDEAVGKLLRYRAYDLYAGYCPKGEEVPLEPPGYNALHDLWPSVVVSARHATRHTDARSAARTRRPPDADP